MQPPYYVLDAKGNPQPTYDAIEWGRWFENKENRVVKQEQVGEQFVSTVFLGMDHAFSGSGPPILWETMILGGKNDQYQERFSSREAALEGHARALAVAKGEVQPEPL